MDDKCIEILTLTRKLHGAQDSQSLHMGCVYMLCIEKVGKQCSI